LAAQVAAVAAEQRGPAGGAALARPENLAAIRQRLAAGRDEEDAVMGVAFELAKTDRVLADEFLAPFLATMSRLGHLQLRPSLRRFLDTGDLVQSVLGGLWQDLAQIEYRTRGEFLSYLSQRLKWKASDHARGLEAGRRREDQRAEADLGELLPLDGPAGPASRAGGREDRERLLAALLKLPPRDRRALSLQLRGSTTQEIAEELDLRPDATRKLLQRAVERTRALMA